MHKMSSDWGASVLLRVLRIQVAVMAFGVVNLLSAGPAHGASQVGAAGGVFSPFSGSTGYSVEAQYLFSSNRLRYGLELGFRDFATKILGVESIGVQTIALRPMLTYHILDNRISPYIGLGLSIDVNLVDTDKIEAARPELDVITRVGVGVGGFGLLGLEYRLTDSIAFFAEGRAGADVQLTDDGDLNAESLGGWEGLGGIRFSFGGK